MNAQQLFLADGTPTTAWRCGNCEQISTEQGAENCCICRFCGEETDDFTGSHKHCFYADWAERFNKTLERK